MEVHFEQCDGKTHNPAGRFKERLHLVSRNNDLVAQNNDSPQNNNQEDPAKDGL